MPEATRDHLRLAGTALAHAVWSIEDGETLCTMAMLERGGERSLTRYQADTIPESIEEGLADLKGRLATGAFAALVYDGYHTNDEGDRHDALIVELLAANEPGSANTASHVGRVVQRYEPGGGGLLRRKRVKLLGRPLVVVGPADAAVSDTIIEGALAHEKARDLFRKIA